MRDDTIRIVSELSRSRNGGPAPAEVPRMNRDDCAVRVQAANRYSPSVRIMADNEHGRVEKVSRWKTLEPADVKSVDPFWALAGPSILVFAA